MTFTDQIQEAAMPLWQRSFVHPFIQELTQGTLPLSTFRYYLIQDYFYLKNFCDLHGEIAAQSQVEAERNALLAGERTLNHGEVAIRQGMFKTLKIEKAEVNQLGIAPTCYNYVNHMRAALAADGPEVGIAALLPCYWLYHAVGLHLQAHGSPVALYQQWIDNYIDNDYVQAVDRMLDLVNQGAQRVDSTTRDQMAEAFVRSSAYELQFWEMAYQKEQWN